jgi:hypothetical protein
MSSLVTCESCRADFDVPQYVREPWLACPHCQARVANPEALRLGGPMRLTWVSDAATALFVLGVLGLCVGVPALLTVGLKASPQVQPALRFRGVVAGTLCSICLLVASWLLGRAEKERATRRLMLVGAGAAVLAAGTLLVFSWLSGAFTSLPPGR